MSEPTTRHELDALDAAMVGRWWDLREYGAPALYSPRAGEVIRCETLDALAAATRHERRKAGARWPEDG